MTYGWQSVVSHIHLPQGQKENGGVQKFFAPELGPPHLQFASYAYEFTTFVRL